MHERLRYSYTISNIHLNSLYFIRVFENIIPLLITIHQESLGVLCAKQNQLALFNLY
jgi:hypothetical protein